MAEPFWRGDEIVEPKPTAPANNYFWSQDEILVPKGEKPSTASDVANSLGSGILKGAIGLFGMPGDAAGGIGWLADTLAEKITGQPLPEKFKANEPAQSVGSARLQKDFEKVTGAPLYEPQTTAGKYARTVGEFLPATGGGVANAVRYAVAPGLASEAAGQATEGTAIEPVARLAAGLTVAAAPSIARRAANPMPISPERAAMADALKSEGVSLTAGQRTGSKPLLYAESALGDAPGAGGRASAIYGRQAEEFTDAAMRRVGESGRATPDVMDAAGKRLADTFDQLSARNTLQADQQLGSDINSALQRYGRKLPSEQRALVGNEAVEIVQRLQQGGGRMPGAEYQTIRSDLSRRGEAARATDPEYGRALKGLRDALDKAMARSVSPEDAKAWEEVRRQYGNYKDLVKAVGGAGSNAAEGLISPQALRTAVATGKNKEAYVRGKGDFASLARAGNALMTPMPNSGTAQRLNILQLVGAGGGGTYGGLPGAIAGAAAPGIAGRLLLSTPTQSLLGKPASAPVGPAGESLMRMLLTGRQSALSGS